MTAPRSVRHERRRLLSRILDLKTLVVLICLLLVLLAFYAVIDGVNTRNVAREDLASRELLLQQHERSLEEAIAESRRANELALRNADELARLRKVADQQTRTIEILQDQLRRAGIEPRQATAPHAVPQTAQPGSVRPSADPSADPSGQPPPPTPAPKPPPRRGILCQLTGLCIGI